MDEFFCASKGVGGEGIMAEDAEVGVVAREVEPARIISTCPVPSEGQQATYRSRSFQRYSIIRFHFPLLPYHYPHLSIPASHAKECYSHASGLHDRD